MYKFLPFINIFIVSLILTACGEDFNEALTKDVLEPMNMWKPKPIGIGEVDPNAPPEYKQGWTDGCETGMYVYGGDTYRYLGYKFKQDYTMITNNDYYNAWQDAYLYCRWYLWNYVRKEQIGGILPF
jgi:hypothetical protein